MSDSASDGLVSPLSFDARYGAGKRRTLVLGGGGVFFIAWQVAYLQALAKRGISFEKADRVVGTSAGSVVAGIYSGGGIRRFATQMGAVARFPAIMGAMPSSTVLTPSQSRALNLFLFADNASPETISRIGHAALAADAPPRGLRWTAGVIIASRRWPARSLHITAVDAFTAERLVLTHRSGVPVAAAAAASSSVPGLFAPQPVKDRRCMDGGVFGSGTHCDLVAGSQKAFVISLSESFASRRQGRAAGMTQQPGSYVAEIQALRDSGTEVITRGPESVDMDSLMKPTSIPAALAMGLRQAEADAPELAAFWR